MKNESTTIDSHFYGRGIAGGGQDARTSASKIQRPDLHPNYIIPVLSNALRVIRLLEDTERPLSLTEVITRTGISRTTAYRILRTLSAHGYLPQGADGVYALRAKLIGAAARSVDSKSRASNRPPVAVADRLQISTAPTKP